MLGKVGVGGTPNPGSITTKNTKIAKNEEWQSLAPTFFALFEFSAVKKPSRVLNWQDGAGRPRSLNSPLALGEGGLCFSEVGQAEAGVDFHRAPGVGQGFSGLALLRESVGEAVEISCYFVGCQ